MAQTHSTAQPNSAKKPIDEDSLDDPNQGAGHYRTASHGDPTLATPTIRTEVPPVQAGKTSQLTAEAIVSERIPREDEQ